MSGESVVICCNATLFRHVQAHRFGDAFEFALQHWTCHDLPVGSKTIENHRKPLGSLGISRRVAGISFNNRWLYVLKHCLRMYSQILWLKEMTS